MNKLIRNYVSLNIPPITYTAEVVISLYLSLWVHSVQYRNDVSPYSISVSVEHFPFAKRFLQKFDYAPHMGNWFLCHVPSFQWQVINNTALTERSLCGAHIYVLTAWALLLEGQRLSHKDVRGLKCTESADLTSGQWQSHVDRIHYLTVSSARWLLQSLCHSNLIWIWQYGYRTCVREICS